MTLLVLTLWLGASFLNWGLTLGDFTRQFPWQRNTEPATFTAFFGLFALIPVLILAQPYVWRLRPLTDDQRWELYKLDFPELAQKYGKERFVNEH